MTPSEITPNTRVPVRWLFAAGGAVVAFVTAQLLGYAQIKDALGAQVLTQERAIADVRVQIAELRGEIRSLGVKVDAIEKR